MAIPVCARVPDFWCLCQQNQSVKILFIRRCAKIARYVLTTLGLLLSGLAVAEIPSLQLGIGNGHYDVATETVVTNSRYFVLHAYSDTATHAGDVYSVAITIVYTPGLDPSDFGIFHFNGQNITAADIALSKPSLGNNPAVIDHRGMARFGLTEARHIRRDFRFEQERRTQPVNTRDSPHHMPVATVFRDDDSYLYFQSFGVSTLGLKDGYNLHFALYLRDQDNSADGSAISSRFAPFSHDAATAYVVPGIPNPVISASPAASISEPEILLLLVLALGSVGYANKRTLWKSGDRLKTDQP